MSRREGNGGFLKPAQVCIGLGIDGDTLVFQIFDFAVRSVEALEARERLVLGDTLFLDHSGEKRFGFGCGQRFEGQTSEKAIANGLALQTVVR